MAIVSWLSCNVSWRVGPCWLHAGTVCIQYTISRKDPKHGTIWELCAKLTIIIAHRKLLDHRIYLRAWVKFVYSRKIFNKILRADYLRADGGSTIVWISCYYTPRPSFFVYYPLIQVCKHIIQAHIFMQAIQSEFTYGIMYEIISLNNKVALACILISVWLNSYWKYFTRRTLISNLVCQMGAIYYQ